MHRSKFPLMVAILLAFALILTGCAPPEEKLETTVNLNLRTEPPTLDPHLATDTTSLAIIDGLFWGLTDIDEKTLEPVPELATEWHVSDDGLVWTFRMRDDVWWVHYDPQTQETDKKRKVTAHDVEYGTKRTIDPATASNYAYVNYVIKNALAVNTGESSNLSSVGVKALDDHTVQFTLEQPAGYFPFIAGMWVNYPLPREVIDQFGDEWTEAGNLWSCGPYVLDTWEHESRMVQVKNPHYYDAKNVSIETINWAMVNDASTALAMYDSGELDSVYPPLADLDRLRADPELSNQLHVIPQLATAYLGFNVSKPPVDNRLVRRALSAALDRQELIDNVLKGGQQPAKTFAPPGIFGSPALDPEFKGITFDPQQAREWLAEAGYPDGQNFPEMTFMFSTGSEIQKIAEFIQKQWKDNLGIDVKLANQEWKVYIGTMRLDPPPVWALGWAADYPDENNWVLEVFHPTKGGNRPQWEPEDPAAKRFMEVTEAAAAESDPAVRKALYFEAEKILCEDEVIIMPTHHFVDIWLTKPYLERIYPVLGLPHIEKWKVRAH
jgi:oligopeptide transport system substrate-binding protein